MAQTRCCSVGFSRAPTTASTSSSYRRGRFNLDPVVSLSPLDASGLSAAILYKDDDVIVGCKEPPTIPQVRRIGRFECADAEREDAPELLQRRRVGRFEVTTWSSACVVSRCEDSFVNGGEVVIKRPSFP